MASRSSSDVWRAVHEERRALLRDLDGLPDDAWHTPSLCPGWTVHDVLAHLVDTALTTRTGFLHSMITARFDFDRSNAAGVRKHRGNSPAETLEAFRSVQHRTSGPPAPPATRLVEAVVHGEDIRRPLDLVRRYPAEPVLAALRHQLKTSVKVGGGRELADGLRLIASDAAFEHGTGDEVRGPAVALLLAVSGRPVRAGELDGDGAAVLRLMQA
ncbi:maleylpyruvate isomerase family mycothiol-dependent enzyme [Arthrobacter sp. 7Tela_A1]|uniref:maleylpyruvate isomerase family mycothiol-dependent enzyme n=1 Tax=Arthrobacter sp. 7Tela_A1 TaxID=3093745 RepID=UPI003BB75108